MPDMDANTHYRYISRHAILDRAVYEVEEVVRVNNLRRISMTGSPFRLLVFGYITVTLAGAILLSLPVSTVDGKGQAFVDALFVATSGISTTGLVVVDIGAFYTLFGQIVLLCVFQTGGIGYMSIILFMAQMLGMRTSIVTQVVASESLAGPGLRELGRFFIATIIFTLIFELAGAVVLSLRWMEEYAFGRAIYLGVFHSISAFCTAGFGLFPDSLMRYRDDTVINVTINVVSLAGGLGFFVLHELFLALRGKRGRKRRLQLSVHTRLVLRTTVLIIGLSSAVLYFSGRRDASMNAYERILVSLFQAISASTTDGFNTVDIGALNMTGLVILMVLMFVGASPGSTGGGIKTTTMGVILRFMFAQLMGRESAVNLFEREIPAASVSKAFGIFTWFILIILADMVVLTMTEDAPFSGILFEVISALGNTGLSTGITPGLSTAGRIVLTITMLIGRVGPLTFGYFIIGRARPLPYRFAEENVFIG
jgi:trk system potassium uptake protein TrkH